MNYGELKTQIGDFHNHSSVTSKVGDFVTLASASIRRDVRVSAMESLTTGTLSSGVLTLPSGYLDARQLVVGGNPYEYVTSDQYQIETSDNTQEWHYTRIGNTLRVVSGGSSSYSLLYYDDFADFSADTDTNWVLTYAPDVYLFCALKFAAVYMKDANAASGYEALYQDAKNKANGADKAGRLSSRSRIRAQVVA